MFGIQYLKVTPNQYVIHYTNGRPRRAGCGLAFFYFRPISSIVSIPISSTDIPYIFNEITQDFQPVTIQGQLTCRITEPEKIAALLDYTIDRAPTRYVSGDPQKLHMRVINLLQVAARAEIQHMTLKEAMRSSKEIAERVMEQFGESKAIRDLGIEILSISIEAIKAVPETARALEAEAREELLRQADLAIYDRRNAAVEQERRIRENELNTEISIEDKQRQIRETRVNADLAVEARQQQVREKMLDGEIKLEKERTKLVSTKAENARMEANAQAYAIEASLKPLDGLNPETLQMLSVQSTDPRLMVSMALREISRNAGKINNLNISPDLLNTLMAGSQESA
ncbi:MAG: SPFH domain-containing protein [Anaerolineales bacterium]|nr:SPFH domain-containing protein [Anaerolineales bacterium]